uniref:Uncharacterized protein n=1 Tax=Setaria italica TaxID=4555 RepID=K3ZBS5_SETIT
MEQRDRLISLHPPPVSVSVDSRGCQSCVHGPGNLFHEERKEIKRKADCGTASL